MEARKAKAVGVVGPAGGYLKSALTGTALTMLLIFGAALLIQSGTLSTGMASALAAAATLVGALAAGGMIGRGGKERILLKGFGVGALLLLLLLILGSVWGGEPAGAGAVTRLAVACLAGSGAGSVLSSCKKTGKKRRAKGR